ncbi:MAG: hypothetical protein V1494_00870 [Candidatus Diapherotrites archaeon]
MINAKKYVNKNKLTIAKSIFCRIDANKTFSANMRILPKFIIAGKSQKLAIIVAANAIAPSFSFSAQLFTRKKPANKKINRRKTLT